jgi:hypothetical protein
MQALEPAGLREWDGPTSICAAFTTCFDDVVGLELVEAVIGDVGTRLYLRWRMRLRAPRLADGWSVLEQHLYADTDPDGLISHIQLLSSGHCLEQNAT